jgi:hypothetical protein
LASIFGGWFCGWKRWPATGHDWGWVIGRFCWLCQRFFRFVLLIFLVFCVVLPTSLDCPFLIWPLLVFSIVYLHTLMLLVLFLVTILLVLSLFK